MIVETFIVFVALAIFCMLYGEWTKELSWTIVGCSILFILAGWVVFGKYTGWSPLGLEFQTGVFINQTSASETVVTNVYSSYDDVTTFWIGFFLTIMAGLGVILTGISRRGR